jgi:hypothetical protein
MDTLNKLIGGLIALTAITVIVRDASGVNTVLTSFAEFNNKTFGTFLSGS